MLPLVDSSVAKIKTTLWIPSSGIKVSVDLANLGRRKGETKERKQRLSREKKNANQEKNNIIFTLTGTYSLCISFGVLGALTREF